jgi:o-succinylbenzoate---CoA ligase
MTSGSTGAPKRIEYERRHVEHAIEASAAHFGWPRGPKFSAWTPLAPHGVGARMMAWRALHLGWTLHPAQPSSQPTVPTGGVHLAALTPHQSRHVLDSDGLPQIQHLLLGGSPLQPALEADLLTASARRSSGQRPRIDLTFGMAETLSHFASRPLGEDVFHCLPSVRIGLSDPDAAQPQQGRLTVHAPDRGLLNLSTNDRIERLDAQHFRWLGRTDHVINSGGVKVHPEQVERWLQPTLSALGIDRFYITGRPDSATGQQVVLVIDGCTSWTDATNAYALLERCAQALPNSAQTHRPRSVEQGRFMLSKAGKLLRMDTNR